MADTRIYQTITSAPNQTLKSTVISIAPFPVVTVIPGLIPGRFIVPAALNDEEPVVEVVGECFHYVYIDPDRGHLKVMDPSYQVANSIVEDYCQAQLEVQPGVHPGIFWELGEWTVEEVKKKFKDRLAAMRDIQNNWFGRLVISADDAWEKTRQHFMISDTERLAARRLGHTSKDKPWLVRSTEEMRADTENKIPTMTCGACGSDIIATAIVCRYCGLIIDAEKHSKLQFASTAQSPSDIATMALRGLRQ